MLPPEVAWERLLPHLEPVVSSLGTARRRRVVARRVARIESAGRVLAAPVVATTDVPAADVSAMDGYALAGAVEAGAGLPVVATVAAGDPPGRRLAAAAAMRIMTGGTVPAGADRVIPVEATDGGEQDVLIRRPVPEGAHIRRRGEIVRAGTELLAPGTELTPPALALLAAQGVGAVEVFAPPRVAFLSTGNEVVPPEAEPAPGQLRDSHTDFLAAECAALGVSFTALGIAADDPESLRRRLAPGLAADVLLLSGGVSKGAFDYVAGILAELRCETLFHGVAIQPGKPLLAARHAAGLVFGLPGNPASVMCAFWLFVRPALRRLGGHSDGLWEGAVRATLDGPLPPGKDRHRFFPALLTVRDGAPHAEPLVDKGSHDLATWGRARALVRVRPGDPAREPGDPCEVLELR
ncbi:MAG: molybdopterin molybdotransferase MoeA [Thermoanaerobaculia bacterium]